LDEPIAGALGRWIDGLAIVELGFGAAGFVGRAAAGIGLEIGSLGPSLRSGLSATRLMELWPLLGLASSASVSAGVSTAGVSTARESSAVGLRLKIFKNRLNSERFCWGALTSSLAVGDSLSNEWLLSG
jgi:hypothetical protein